MKLDHLLRALAVGSVLVAGSCSATNDGATLSEDGATYSSQYHGRTFEFCSLRCKSRFELSPEEFLPLDDGLTVSQALLLGAVA